MNSYASPLAPQQSIPAFQPLDTVTPIPPARILAPLIGKLVQCGPGQAMFVNFAGNPLGEPVAARATVPLDPAAVGGDVVLLFEEGDPARPVILGAILPETPPREQWRPNWMVSGCSSPPAGRSSCAAARRALP